MLQPLFYRPEQTLFSVPVFSAFGFFAACLVSRVSRERRAGKLVDIGNGTDGGFFSEQQRDVGAGTDILTVVVEFTLVSFSPEMMPTVAAPSCDGNGESFPNYAHKAELWFRATNSDGPKGASALVLQMNPVARNDQLSERGGMQAIARILHDFSAPGTLDSVNQDVARFLQFRPTAQTMGGYPARCDLLRQKAAGRMKMGGPSPGTFLSDLRMKNAPLSRTEKSPVLATAEGSSGIAAAARQMRQLFGPTGIAGAPGRIGSDGGGRKGRSSLR